MNTDTDKETGFFEETGNMVNQYIRDRLLLFKLQATEKAAHLTALLISAFLIGLIGFFILLFISIMAGYFFAGLTGSLFLGFGIIGLIYIILFVLLIVLRKKFIHSYVANLIVQIVFEKQKDDDDDENNTR